MENTDKQFSDQSSLGPFLKRLFGLAIKKYPKLAALLLFGVLVTAFADAAIPKMWQILMDKLVIPQVKIFEEMKTAGLVYQPQIADFTPYILMYSVWIVTITLSVLLFIYAAQQLQERLMFDLREGMFKKLQYLSFSFYDKNSLGWLVSRITSDTNRVTEIISWGAVSVIWGLTMIVATFVVMLTINVKLALLVILTLPFLVFVSIKIRMLILLYSRKARKQGSELTAYFIEHVNGIEVNKSTIQEEKASANYREKSALLRQNAYRSAYYTAMFIPLVIVIGSVATVLVLWYGGSLAVVEKYGFGIAALSSFFIASRSVFEPIFDISRFYAMAQDSLAAGERIFSLIDETVDIGDNNKIAFGKIKGDIEFKNVGFYYEEAKPILKNFNLKINAGESIALVGPTGHGKTTITSLLNRFYEPNSGQILIDGIDYQDRTLHSFRNQMGVILQSPHLFSGTVRDNIVFGLENITDQKVVDTLQLIGADSLAEKLNLEVGEEGSNLSNGERQLVSFARAIIKEPAILVMDEATSSIDTITEAKIQKGINTIIKGRTSIIIAHRLSTIKNCDRIVVIENGAIQEMGTHNELMEAGGHYANLYKG